MSGFSPDWLALREPADHASVNAAVRLALRRHFAGRPRIAVLDLGSGTGSNLRGLSPWLDAEQDWTLVDYDAALLGIAHDRFSANPIDHCTITTRQLDLAAAQFNDVVEGADLVTASALFDLVSATVIERLAAAVAARRQVFATVLTYDGIMSFLPEHPRDAAMRRAFNDHQRGDKGFGPAEGPAATNALAAAFARHGYRILIGKSPWVLDRRYDRLRRELDMGFAGAVRETASIAAADVDAWIAHRLAAQGEEAVTIVGHEDILALPPE